MPYTESHSELRDHPKVKRLRRILSASIPAVIGHLHLLWWFVLDYAPRGDLTNFSPEDIADAAGWEGDSHAFVDALIACGGVDQPGFLERNSTGRLLVHDWWQYGGKVYVKRWVDAFRKREFRAPTPREMQKSGLPMNPDVLRALEESKTGDEPLSDLHRISDRGQPEIPGISSGVPQELPTTSIGPPSDIGTQLSTSSNTTSDGGRSDIRQRSQVEQSREEYIREEQTNSVPRAHAYTHARDGTEERVEAAANPDPPDAVGVDVCSVDKSLSQRLFEAGVRSDVAERLARSHTEESERQLRFLPFHDAIPGNRGGFLADAIRKRYDPPNRWEAHQAAQVEQASRREMKAAQKIRTEERKRQEIALQAKIESLKSEQPDDWRAILAEARSRIPVELTPEGNSGKPTPLFARTLESQVRTVVTERYLTDEARAP